MNKKYVNAIIYTSIFSIAYGGLLYHRYTLKHAVSKLSATAKSHIVTTADTALNNIKTLSASDYDLAYNQPDISEKAATFKDKKKEAVRKISWQQKKYTHISSPAVYTYTRQSSNKQQRDYTQAAQYTRPAMAFTSTTASTSGINYTQNNISSQSYPISLRTDSSGNNTSNINSTITTGSIDQSQIETDGSEFLPDGSSQQDLFSSQSKSPRVYTIKSYQSADISCAPGYDDVSSPHATLIRGLKGC